MSTTRVTALAEMCLAVLTLAVAPSLAADSPGPTSFPAQGVAYAAPKIMHPLDGWKLTDVGVSFRWRRQCEPGKWTTWKYQLQVADTADFAKPFIDRTVLAPGDPAHPENLQAPGRYMYWKQTSYQPPEVLAPGKWYWRVRVADGQGGPWSKVESFTVNDNHDTAEPVRPLSAHDPLFIFDMYNLETIPDAKWSAYWATIPDDLKPYVAFQVNRFGVGAFWAPDQSYIDIMKRLADLKIPAMIGTGGPDKPVANYADLAEVEYLFQHCRNIEGIVTGETFWAYGERAAEECTYYLRLLQLCGKYGKYFIQGDGNNAGHFNWDRFFARKPGGPSFNPTCDRMDRSMLHKYADYFVPCPKTNIRDSFFEAQSAVLGAWVSGLVGHMGYWHEAWYWWECHFDDIFDAKTHVGDLRKMPPILWDQAFLVGVASGATVLKFGGETSVVESDTYDAARDSFEKIGPNYTALWDMAGHKTQVLDRYIIPFLRGIVAHKMIPTRQEVRASVPCLIDPGAPDSDKGSTIDYGRFAPLYQATYGLRDYRKFDPAASDRLYTLTPPAGTSARFVRLTLPGKARTLNVAEVQVFSGGTDIAPAGTASQSSTDYGGAARRAIDGNLSGVWESRSITQTREQTDPWWQVDLGAAKPIEKIVIYGRSNFDDRLVGVRVALLDADRHEVWHVDTSTPDRVFTPNGAQYELLPNSSRYYFLPVVPHPARALPGLQVMSIADLATEADVHKALDEKCKPRYTGDAWVVMMGPRLYITNSEENRNVAQTFSLPLPGPIERLSGRALPHSYMMGRLSEDGGTLWLQANVNVKGPYTDDRTTDLVLHCATAPEVKADPADALAEKTWDTAKQDLHVRLSHKAGAVDLYVRVGPSTAEGL